MENISKDEASKILQSKLQKTSEALSKLHLDLLEPAAALKHSELKDLNEQQQIENWAKNKIAAQQQ